eukprot:6468289-Amphidinium_carterae.5
MDLLCERVEAIPSVWSTPVQGRVRIANWASTVCVGYSSMGKRKGGEHASDPSHSIWLQDRCVSACNKDALYVGLDLHLFETLKEKTANTPKRVVVLVDGNFMR